MPMAMIRFEPFQDADTLRYQLNQLFNGRDATRVSSWTRQGSWTPAVEIRETDEAVQLYVATPGLTPEQIDVHVSQSAVLIEGELHHPDETSGERLLSSEFLYGHFRRFIPLNMKVEQRAARAEMRDGLTILNIPKAQEERNRVFRVRLSEPHSGETIPVQADKDSVSA